MVKAQLTVLTRGTLAALLAIDLDCRIHLLPLGLAATEDTASSRCCKGALLLRSGGGSGWWQGHRIVQHLDNTLGQTYRLDAVVATARWLVAL